MKVSGSVQIITDPDPGGPNTYESYGSETLLTTDTVVTTKKFNKKR